MCKNVCGGEELKRPLEEEKMKKRARGVQGERGVWVERKFGKVKVPLGVMWGGKGH